MEMTERLVTIREAAGRCSLAPATLRKWVATGRLPSVKLGRARRLRESVIVALIEAGVCPARERWDDNGRDHGS